MSTGRKIKRYHSITGLRREKADYYIELHKNTWPGVQKRITDCHIQNYSIATIEMSGQLYLLSYFEYTGDDYEEDMKKMATDPETQRWWKETDPCQLPPPEAKAKGQIWTAAKEVFFQA